MAFQTVSHVGFTWTGAMPDFTCMIDNQTQHIAAIMAELTARRLKYVEASRAT